MMGAVIWLTATVLGPQLEVPGSRVLALFIIMVLGIVSYGIAGCMTGAFTFSELRRLMRR